MCLFIVGLIHAVTAPVPGGGDLPVFAYVLFGVTGVLLLVALVIPIAVCCYRSCFHRRIKLVSPQKCSDAVEYALGLCNKINVAH